MKCAYAAGVLLALVFFPASAPAVPINGDAALPISEGVWLTRQQIRYHRLNDDRQGAGRKMLALEIPMLLAYGVTANDGVFFTAPYVRKAMRRADGSWRSGEGLGDGALWLKRIFEQDDKPGRTRRWAWVAGTSLPFGKDDATDAEGRLPQTLQPASGAFDPFAGVVFSDQGLGGEFDLDVSYRFRRPANQYEFGDRWTFNLSYQKRLSPKSIPSVGAYTQFNAVVEFNGEWSEWDRSGDVADVNTGGRKIFLCPGIQWAGERTILEASVQLPMLMNLRGRQIEPSAVYVGSVRMAW